VSLEPRVVRRAYCPACKQDVLVAHGHCHWCGQSLPEGPPRNDPSRARGATMTTGDDVRAVLLSLADASGLYSRDMAATIHSISDRFDAAADQQRIQWCVEHGRVASRFCPGRCSAWTRKSECRIVDALVVPLPQSGGDMPDRNYADPFGPPGMMGG
jgi:hypothetical protein